MFFFLQEKNNTDRNSFYTPQIISDMITQSVCDNLDDSSVLFGKDRTLGRAAQGTGRETGDIKIPAGPSVSVNILIAPSADPGGKNFSSVLYSHKELYGTAHALSSSLYDFGKSVAYDHEERRPKLISYITNSLDKPKKEKTKINAENQKKESATNTPSITILPFNLYSPNLLDYLRHIKMLSESITDCLVEIV